MLPGAEEAVRALGRTHRVVLVTKGDLVDQRRKLAASGLAGCFSHVEIVPDKTPATYDELLRFLGVAAERFLMVGNSEVSDVHPVLELGGWAVHVPYRTTWVLERAETAVVHERRVTVASLSEVPALLQRREAPRPDRHRPASFDGLLPPLAWAPCAASWATSAASRRWRSWSTGCAGWSTAATTAPASPCSAPTACGSSARPASWPTSRRSWSSGSWRARWASATPAGRPTARPPTPTRTPTSTATGWWPSSTTGPSRTTRSSCAGSRSAGHERRSDTDTEVVAHLLEERYADGPTPGDLPASLRSVCRDLEGSFVLVVAHRDEPDLVVAARRNLPLVIGLGEGENFVGSDVTAFIAHTREARAVEQDQVVEVRRSGVVVTDLDGTVVDGESYHVDWDTAAAEKGGYDFFMLKEIDEQPEAIRATLGGRLHRGRPAAPRRARR